MDEFLLIFLGEKTFNSVDVFELVKSCLGDSFDVAAESLKVFTNADPLLFATKQNDLSFVFI